MLLQLNQGAGLKLALGAVTNDNIEQYWIKQEVVI